MKKRYPRYFVHVNGFADGTRFVRCDDRRKTTLIREDWSEQRSGGYPLNKCMSYVRDGRWREVDLSVEKVSA